MRIIIMETETGSSVLKLVVSLDGIFQSSGLTYHWNGCVTHTHQLTQTAWFKQ